LNPETVVGRPVRGRRMCTTTDKALAVYVDTKPVFDLL